MLKRASSSLPDHVTKCEYFGQRGNLKRRNLVSDDYTATTGSLRDLLTSPSTLLNDLHFRDGVSSLLSRVEADALDWPRAARAMVSHSHFVLIA